MNQNRPDISLVEEPPALKGVFDRVTGGASALTADIGRDDGHLATHLQSGLHRHRDGPAVNDVTISILIVGAVILVALAIVDFGLVRRRL